MDKGNICFHFEDGSVVYFRSTWDGNCLPRILQRAMGDNDRPTEEMAGRIATAMVTNAAQPGLGFSVGMEPLREGRPTIHVDYEMVWINGGMNRFCCTWSYFRKMEDVSWEALIGE